MEQRQLGQSGLTVPAVGMGTWRTFDVRGVRDASHARGIVGWALDAGVNFFDSSPMYGEAERVLGAALTGRRERALVATKIWTRSAADGRAQAMRALAFFGGGIDHYQVHNLVNWPQQVEMLERLQSEGRVKAIGATHYSASAFDELAHVMNTDGSTGTILEKREFRNRSHVNRQLRYAGRMGDARRGRPDRHHLFPAKARRERAEIPPRRHVRPRAEPRVLTIS